jgi:hypothetical protein
VDDAQGQMWGLDNLQTFLSTASGSDRTELDALYAALQQMHGPVLEDDFSIVRLDFC